MPPRHNPPKKQMLKPPYVDRKARNEGVSTLPACESLWKLKNFPIRVFETIKMDDIPANDTVEQKVRMLC
jgi:hypothetical protein